MENGNIGGSANEPASRIAARALARAAASSTRADDDWKQLSGRLHLALDALQEDEYLIISIRGTNRYVQFSAQGPFGMRAEATSNYYLPDGEDLDEGQHRSLLKLGWRAPTNLPEGIGPHETEGSPNYFVELEPPVDHGFLAALAVITLASVFGAPDARQLEYRAFDDDGTPILFPTLGIALAEA
jgi:hypothetical protein